MAQHIGYVPITSEGPRVVVEHGLADHGGIFGEEAEGGQNYNEAHNDKGCDQPRLLGQGILEESGQSSNHLALSSAQKLIFLNAGILFSPFIHYRD